VTTAVGYLDAGTAAYVEEVLGAIAAHVPLVEAYLVGSGATGGFMRIRATSTSSRSSSVLSARTGKPSSMLFAP